MAFAGNLKAVELFTVDMKVNSLHIVVNLEFLLRVSDFFIKGLPKTTPASPSPPSPPS